MLSAYLQLQTQYLLEQELCQTGPTFSAFLDNLAFTRAPNALKQPRLQAVTVNLGWRTEISKKKKKRKLSLPTIGLYNARCNKLNNHENCFSSNYSRYCLVNLINWSWYWKTYLISFSLENFVSMDTHGTLGVLTTIPHRHRYDFATITWCSWIQLALKLHHYFTVSSASMLCIDTTYTLAALKSAKS